jgi:hypothetical protein
MCLTLKIISQLKQIYYYYLKRINPAEIAEVDNFLSTKSNNENVATLSDSLKKICLWETFSGHCKPDHNTVLVSDETMNLPNPITVIPLVKPSLHDILPHLITYRVFHLICSEATTGQ